MVRIVMIIIALVLVSDVKAQFARASLSKKKVLVEQPVRIKITAYSPTWFAEPLTFSNLRVNGAFIQSFSRTVPGIQYVNNKKYATIEFYYILFPYQAGELVFPELTLTTSIPPEGEYKGKPVTLKTKAITIQVDPVPADADQEHWLIANDVRITNQWSADIKTLKVGDVIKRSITTEATGTLPSFIDEPDIGTADFASIYNSEPEFIDDRDDKNVNGRRIDRYSYLIEKTGSFTIPEVQITWWNPYAGKYYSRKLPAYEFVVADNPDMSSLQHLKDSLNSLNQPMMAEGEEPQAELDYMYWTRVIAFVILAIVLLRWTWSLILMLVRKFKIKRQEYLESEAYWFSQVQQQNDEVGLINSMYRWLDRAPFESRTITTISSENREFATEIEKLQKDSFSTVAADKYSIKKIKQGVFKYRKRFLEQRNRKPSKNDLENLNS